MTRHKINRQKVEQKNDQEEDGEAVKDVNIKEKLIQAGVPMKLVYVALGGVAVVFIRKARWEAVAIVGAIAGLIYSVSDTFYGRFMIGHVKKKAVNAFDQIREKFGRKDKAKGEDKSFADNAKEGAAKAGEFMENLFTNSSNEQAEQDIDQAVPEENVNPQII